MSYCAFGTGLRRRVGVVQADGIRRAATRLGGLAAGGVVSKLFREHGTAVTLRLTTLMVVWEYPAIW
jgi:hypothetical protein